MPKPQPIPKKKAPQDSTLRNVRAASKRLTALEQRVTTLEQQLARLALQTAPARG